LVGCAGVPTPPPISAAPGTSPRPDEGVRFRSEDGENEIFLEGLFQVVGIVAEGERRPSSDFRLKRMRPELSGRFAGGMEFRLEPNFDEEGVELEEAWIGPLLADGRARLMLGRMKAPFGLEEVRSRRHIDFPGFSLLNQFSPAEDHGLFVSGRSPSGFWEYGLGAYNGTGASDTNSSKDVAARLMLHPFARDEGSVFHNLQAGVAVTAGSQDEDVAESVIKNEAGLPVLRFADDARLDGGRERLGLEAAWFRGPWFTQAEGLWLEQEMANSGGGVDARVRGAYATLSRVLTGEDKTFAGVHPADAHDFAEGRGRGAWVLALRYAELRLDDDPGQADLFEAGTFTDRIRSLSLGLNWIPNENAIVRTAWVHSAYGNSVSLESGRTDEEDALLVELQLHF
jgi:phosphate-selective porin